MEWKQVEEWDWDSSTILGKTNPKKAAAISSTMMITMRPREERERERERLTDINLQIWAQLAFSSCPEYSDEGDNARDDSGHEDECPIWGKLIARQNLKSIVTN